MHQPTPSSSSSTTRDTPRFSPRPEDASRDKTRGLLVSRLNCASSLFPPWAPQLQRCISLEGDGMHLVQGHEVSSLEISSACGCGCMRNQRVLLWRGHARIERIPLPTCFSVDTRAASRHHQPSHDHMYSTRAKCALCHIVRQTIRYKLVLVLTSGGLLNSETVGC